MRGSNLLITAACFCALNAASAELLPRETEVLQVPSGQPVAFFETVLDRPGSGLTAHFRFTAPELRQTLQRLSFMQIEADLAYLCESYALQRIAAPYPVAIVISLAETDVEFGAADPSVMQVFEAYRPAGETCEWEAF